MNTKNQVQVIIILLLLILIAISVSRINILQKSNSKSEDYHFGFPTWGSVNNSPWSRGWGGVRNPFMLGYNPYMQNRPYYYKNYVRPYLTGRCYTSSEGSGCQPGYISVGTDTNEDGVKNRWQCCRKWLI